MSRALFLALTGFQLLMPGWRGYFLSWLALLWIAIIYMSLFGRLGLDIRHERWKWKTLTRKPGAWRDPGRKQTRKGVSCKCNRPEGEIFLLEIPQRSTRLGVCSQRKAPFYTTVPTSVRLKIGNERHTKPKDLPTNTTGRVEN